MQRRFSWCLLVCLFTFSSCAHPRHVAVVADTALYEVLNDTHVLEQRALCGQPSCANVSVRVTPGWTDAKSQAFNQKLLPAVRAGQEFTLLLEHWKAGASTPPQIEGLTLAIADALRTITADFPPGGTKDAILAKLAEAQSAILRAFTLYLTIKGA